MSHLVRKRICTAVSPWTGEKCKAKAVGPNTLKKGTREFLDDRFCQMHQPGVESKKKCICPHCHYHRSRDKFPTINVSDSNTASTLSRKLKIDEEVTSIHGKFGKTGKKKKHTNNKKVKP